MHAGFSGFATNTCVCVCVFLEYADSNDKLRKNGTTTHNGNIDNTTGKHPQVPSDSKNINNNNNIHIKLYCCRRPSS